VSWVTVIWSMIAATCLTLAVIYGLVWYRQRGAWDHLLFSITAVSTAVYALCELLMMRAETPAQFLAAVGWSQLPLFFWLVALTWFVRTYLEAGRTWLAWTICGMRTIFVIPFLLGRNLNFSAITSLRHINFLGEPVTVVGAAVRNPLTLFGQSAVLLVLLFVADASVAAWRRGDRRKALMVGGGIEFFLVAALATSSAVFWGQVEAPIVISVCYLGTIAVMAYELTRDVLRASQLVDELRVSEAGLRESEARMSLAVDVADFGIWIRHLPQNDIWASEKWRELFGFAPTEHLDFDTILKRLHPDDRDGLEDAHAMTIAGADGGNYQTEYRLVLQDGTIRWISSRGRLERDAAGEPLLIRGASHDITERKRAEIDVRNLSGRLLSAQEGERRRIARELHDNLSQQIALLAIEIDAVALNVVRPPATLAQSLHELRERTAQISSEIHNLSHRLHSSKLEMLGLVAALRGHCQELLAQGIDAHLEDENVPRSLPPDVELCLFRIVQEALNNVVKHSGTREAHVTLRAADDVLVLSITDFGRGFDERRATGSGDGLGLASMRERLRLINGELTIRSQSGHGTTITARVPIPKARPVLAATVTRTG